MITGTIKNKIDAIWTGVWTGGITNPLTVIEQLTYLMFIRSLDVKEMQTERLENAMGFTGDHIFPKSAVGQAMRWSHFKDRSPEDIFHIVRDFAFPAIQHMKNGHLPDFDASGKRIPLPDETGEKGNAFATFMADASFVIPTPKVLERIVTGLEDLYTHDIEDKDMQGDLYEYMLSKLQAAGQNGQFRTPKHIREMMVELMAPTPADSICDPACGTAGFLVSSAQYITAHYGDTMTDSDWTHYKETMFHGFDTDQTMLRISAMNLMLHGIIHPCIAYQDSLSKQNQTESAYTLCLANPPFKGSIDAESIHEKLKAVTNTKKTELLFLALFLRTLKKGGRCAPPCPSASRTSRSTAAPPSPSTRWANARATTPQREPSRRCSTTSAVLLGTSVKRPTSVVRSTQRSDSPSMPIRVSAMRKTTISMWCNTQSQTICRQKPY